MKEIIILAAVIILPPLSMYITVKLAMFLRTFR